MIGSHVVRHVPETDTIEVLQRDGGWKRVGGHFNLCVELTTACNQVCRNCFSSSSPHTAGIHSDMEQVIRTIGDASEAVVRVNITGGEPLLHPQFDELLELPDRYSDLAFALSSNLTLRPDVDDALVAHGWYVWTSLHGLGETHNHYTRSNSFDIVVQRIRRLSRRLPVRINVLIHSRLSENDVDWLHSFKDECGIPMLRFVVPRAGGRFTGLPDERQISMVASRLDAHSELRSTRLPNALVDVNGIWGHTE